MFTRSALCLILSISLVVSTCFAAKICVDPGHGGTDSGAVGCGNLEDTNNLNTGLRFGDWLNLDTSDGTGGGSWAVVMTRSTDVFVSLSGRCSISNSNACDRFMCNHNNACNSCGASGTETWSYTNTGTDADLRNKVQSRVVAAWGLNNRGNKVDTVYTVLKYTNAPAELVELGFIDNCTDSAKCSSASTQNSAALAFLYAIQNHLGIAAYTPTSTPAVNPPYDFPSNQQGWTGGNGVSDARWTNTLGTSMYVYQLGNDAQILGPACNFAGAANQALHLVVYPNQVAGSYPGHDLQLFWATGGGFDASRSSDCVRYIAANTWVDIYLNADWAGQTISKLRVDPDGTNGANAAFYFDKIEVVNLSQPPYGFASGGQGWASGNGLGGLTWTNLYGWPGVIFCDQTGDDAQFIGPTMYLTGNSSHQVHVRLRVQNENKSPHDMQVFWRISGDSGFAAEKGSAVVNYTLPGGDWADVYLPVGSNANWNGQKITQLRLDVDGQKGSTSQRYLIDTIEIQ